MEFKGFLNEDFDIFTIQGLDERMAAIQEKIQPKFRSLGTNLTDELSSLLGQEMYLHIAKHARRTVNPPKDTWLAIGPNKRGYKQYPHFQVGLFDDHLFIWLAYIYELPNKEQIAQNMLNHLEELKDIIPNDFVVSTNHMQKNSTSITELNLKETLERFKKVKKAEFLIGKNIPTGQSILSDGSALTQLITDTYKILLPIYQMSFND